MADVREIKVFIASPNDLPAERQAFRDVCDELNRGFGEGADCRFIPLGWENTLSSVGRRSQAVINQDIDACDVFILAMWRRWGQPAPDSDFDSYTEEEFHRALDRFKKDGMPVIFVFFKYIDPGQIADPGAQLQKVLSFHRELEESRTVIYRKFKDDATFRDEISNHLCAFAKGTLPARDAVLEPMPLSIDLVRRVEAAESLANHRAKEAERLWESLLRRKRVLKRRSCSWRVKQLRRHLMAVLNRPHNPLRR